MNPAGLSPKEIQQQIFDEIAHGTNPQTLKETLRQQGIPEEGYYFTTEAKHTEEVLPPAESTSPVTGWQVFWTIVTILILILKIARCNNRM